MTPGELYGLSICVGSPGSLCQGPGSIPSQSTMIFGGQSGNGPVPVTARSKAYVCGRSPTEIVGSYPTGGMDVCLL
jgi:hypothetical protein